MTWTLDISDSREQRRRRLGCHLLGVLGLVVVGVGIPLQGWGFLAMSFGQVSDDTMNRLSTMWMAVGLALGLLLGTAIWLVSRSPRRPVDAVAMRVVIALYLVAAAVATVGEIEFVHLAANVTVSAHAKGAT